MSTYGFADSHSTLIGYMPYADDEGAAEFAQRTANERGEPIEYWLDERGPDGEPAESMVAYPD